MRKLTMFRVGHM